MKITIDLNKISVNDDKEFIIELDKILRKYWLENAIENRDFNKIKNNPDKAKHIYNLIQCETMEEYWLYMEQFK